MLVYLQEQLQCTFRSPDMGVAFQANGIKAEVVAYVQMLRGGFGPAPSTGTTLLPGDIINSVNGDSATAALVSASGILALAGLGADAYVRLEFERPDAQSIVRNLGGRPKARPTKYSSKSGFVEQAADSSSAPKRKAPKPHRTQSRYRAKRAANQPAAQGVDVREVLTRLAAGLSAERREAIDRELESATYIA